mgnify:CR=1 FL=1
MKLLKKMLLSNKFTRNISLAVKHYLLSYKLYRKTSNYLNSFSRKGKVIFYLGIPAHSNLGDLAQGVCIRRWLKKNYSDCQVIELETNSLVNTPFPLLNRLVNLYESGDMIVYQSGYTTTDLGGYADEMHRAVMEALPNANMLMLPQTIFFKKEENKMRTAKCYNSMKHMLYLARDRVSFNMAKEMFPDIPVMQFPDIVTTLIGNYKYDYNRDGIMFCCRDDDEKFYSDEEIASLIKRCEKHCRVDRTDTTKHEKTNDIVANAEKYIMDEVDKYAHYKIVITDRYHGTILSLVAGTPVIIIKTTDHKVITGAEWFKGVYDEYVFVAKTLDEAYEIATKLLKNDLEHSLFPYFEENYYDRLPEIFNEKVGR